jgi:putative transposase
VVYQSKQSYYDLLKAAGISWHRTEPVNPKRDEAKVLQKREEIKSILHAREAEIKSGEVIVFMEDECHLLSGDTSGYVWGRRNERIEVPVQNAKERQTYYGVIDGYHREFILQPATAGNGKNTIALIEHLQQRHEGKKLILIWDGASYHRSSEIKAYLAKVNEGLEEKNWKVTCIRFATNAPDQHPVEDIWLRGKNFLRRHFYENKTFSQVKNSFFNFLNQQIFNFKKLEWYLEIPQII